MAVNQKGSHAGRDIVGRDKNELHQHAAPLPKLTKIDKLKITLKNEISDGAVLQDIIEDLTSFKRRVVVDGIVGLEAKLEKSGRAQQILSALEMKEKFAKLLERWSLYASAQEIFVHLLAMADYKYSHLIFPQIESLSAVEVDEIINEKIIEPAIEEVGTDVFCLDHHTAMGMVYWLAEQCRVRWHK